MHSIDFQSFFVLAFKIVVDSWKFNMLLLYIWDDWPIFYDFRFKWTATAGIRIHPTKTWWISKMQSDTLEERYAIKLCFKLGKKCNRNVWNASDCFSAKGLGLGLALLCWGFKGVQEEIPREEASTLQIGSVAFPPGQYTCPQLHPCHRLFDQDGHQDSSSPSL